MISLTNILLTLRCYLLPTSIFLLLQTDVLPLFNQLITQVRTRTSLSPTLSTLKSQSLMSVLSVMIPILFISAPLSRSGRLSSDWHAVNLCFNNLGNNQNCSSHRTCKKCKPQHPSFLLRSPSNVTPAGLKNPLQHWIQWHTFFY